MEFRPYSEGPQSRVKIKSLERTIQDPHFVQYRAKTNKGLTLLAISTKRPEPDIPELPMNPYNNHFLRSGELVEMLSLSRNGYPEFVFPEITAGELHLSKNRGYLPLRLFTSVEGFRRYEADPEQAMLALSRLIDLGRYTRMINDLGFHIGHLSSKYLYTNEDIRDVRYLDLGFTYPYNYPTWTNLDYTGFLDGESPYDLDIRLTAGYIGQLLTDAGDLQFPDHDLKAIQVFLNFAESEDLSKRPAAPFVVTDLVDRLFSPDPIDNQLAINLIRYFNLCRSRSEYDDFEMQSILRNLYVLSSYDNDYKVMTIFPRISYWEKNNPIEDLQEVLEILRLNTNEYQELLVKDE